MCSYFKGVNLSIIFQKNNYLFLKVLFFLSKIHLYLKFQNKNIHNVPIIKTIHAFLMFLMNIPTKSFIRGKFIYLL
jgi:hypothetical protein